MGEAGAVAFALQAGLERVPVLRLARSRVGEAALPHLVDETLEERLVGFPLSEDLAAVPVFFRCASTVWPMTQGTRTLDWPPTYCLISTASTSAGSICPFSCCRCWKTKRRTRAFFEILETQRKGEYAASERRINIPKESWYLQHTPQGDMLLAYIESPDFANALAVFTQSEDEFDRWFKRRIAELTGVDLNDPPPGPLSEQPSSYEA